jgi:hypothetical protein
MNPKELLQKVKAGTVITENEVRALCSSFEEVLASENNLLRLEAPINIVGDVHGQLYDVIKIFEIGKASPNQEENCPWRDTCFWETTWTEGTIPCRLSCCWPASRSCTPIESTSCGATTNPARSPACTASTRKQ